MLPERWSNARGAIAGFLMACALGFFLFSQTPARSEDAASASVLKETPRSDPNSLRSGLPTSDRHVPLPLRKPKASGELKAEDSDPRIAIARAKCETLLESAAAH